MSTEINNNSDRMQRLHSEALQLPETPGVYIMHDASDKIIYVGKSRNLRNRVSQYFGNNEKNAKTTRMVASVRRFECIHCDTEIEALTLENTIPQCQYCNQTYKDYFLFNEHGRVVAVNNPLILLKSPKDVQDEMITILLKEREG